MFFDVADYRIFHRETERFCKSDWKWLIRRVSTSGAAALRSRLLTPQGPTMSSWGNAWYGRTKSLGGRDGLLVVSEPAESADHTPEDPWGPPRKQMRAERVEND
jgi:hypothetical protein